MEEQQEFIGNNRTNDLGNPIPIHFRSGYTGNLPSGGVILPGVTETVKLYSPCAG